MFSQFWPKLIAASLALILCVAVLESWRADRRDRSQLAAELAATKQLLLAADARQRNRDAQLAQTLSALDAQKRATVTSDQIIRQLQKNIPLPAPIALLSTPQDQSTPQDTDGPHDIDHRRGTIHRAPAGPPTEDSSNSHSASSNSQPETVDKPQTPPSAIIPTADLKPLYDFTLDCQACLAKLSAAQNDLADEKYKTAALTKERDDALSLAKGGSAWRRLTRAAKWFLLGAAAGTVVAKTR